MSGKYRKQIGPARQKLTDIYFQADTLMDTVIEDTAPELLPKIKKDVRKVMSTLRNNIAVIDNAVEGWNDLIANLKDPHKVQDEQDIFDVNVEGAEGPPVVRGYGKILSDSKDALSTLELLELDIERTLERARNPNVPRREGDKTTAETSTPQQTPNIPLETQADVPEGSGSGQTIRRSDSATTSTRIRREGAEEDAVLFPHAKMPEIKIPFFSGDSAQWPEFWGVFDHLVNQRNIPKTLKLIYLKGYLKDQASRLLSGMEATDSNYDVAVQLLTERFGRPQLITKALQQKYSELQVSHHPTAKELRVFSDNLVSLLERMKTLDLNLDTNPIVISNLLEKIPADVLKEMELFLPEGSEWDVSMLRKQLLRYVERAEHYAEKAGQKPTTRSNPERHKTSETKESGGAKNTNPPEEQKKQPSKPRYPCILCTESGHFPANCPSYTTPDERRKQITVKGFCFRCLKLHKSTENKCSPEAMEKKCFYCGTVGKHHQAACFYGPGGRKRKEGTQEKKDGTQEEPAKSAAEREQQKTGGTPMKKVFNQTATTVLKNPTSSRLMKSVRVFFDCGAQRTYIKTSVAKALKLAQEFEEELQVSGFQDRKTRFQSEVVVGQLLLRNGNCISVDMNTEEAPVGLMVREGLSPEDRSFCQNLPDSDFADSLPIKEERFEPDILLGGDYYPYLVDTGKKIQLPSGAVLFSSEFGWILAGQDGERFPGTSLSKNAEDLISIQDLHTRKGKPKLESAGKAAEYPIDKIPSTGEVLGEMQSLETIGIRDNPVETDDQKAEQIFTGYLKYENGRYAVPLPLRQEVEELHSNYALAKGRLRSLGKRFEMNPSIQQKYTEVIKEQEELGIIEEVIEKEPKKEKVHHLAHHAVVREDHETTKVRIVMDGSAKTSKENYSLNDVLFTGPDLLPILPGILIRFRMMSLVLTADVEKAFLQLSVLPEYRDYLRFLYFKDPNRPAVDGNLKVFRFARVPFGLNCSPYLLNATISHHLSAEGSTLSLKTKKNMYVDNVILGVEDSEEPGPVRDQLKEIFGRAGMNLRSWSSNDQDFNLQIPEGDRAQPEGYQKILGIHWDQISDSLTLPPVGIREDSPTTCRTVLKQLATYYDPLGLGLPVAFHGKVFFQSLLTQNFKWDDNLPEDIIKEWRKIQTELQKVSTVAFPRRVSVSHSESVQIAVFTDASIKSYGTVAYLRTVKNDSDVSINVIYAKMRLAPKGKKGYKISLPRLELLGAFLGGRIIRFLKTELGESVSRVWLFTDSSIVLAWLKTKKMLGTFVNNRVKDIKSEPGTEFQYVPTESNPADKLTRGLKVREWEEDELWWKGPYWLKEPEDQWPQIPAPTLNTEMLQEYEAELKQKPENTLQAVDGMKQEIHILQRMDPSRFSSWDKLKRSTVFVLRFLRKLIPKFFIGDLKHKQVLNFSRITEDNLIKAEEIEVAEKLWIRKLQSENFGEIFSALKKGRKHSFSSQFQAKVDEEGILRMMNRMEPSESNEGGRILLPRNNPVTKLIILKIHEELCHQRVDHTWAELKKCYWVPRGRPEVKRILDGCILCRKVGGGPFVLPDMPQLPKERICRSEPFQYTGLDYLGPVQYRKEKGAEPERIWVCLFTCLAVRAIHLELIPDLSTVTFLNAVKRFICRRGKPEQIISDNFSSFRLGRIVLDRAWEGVLKDSELHSHLASEGIRWKFITQMAPWQGGFYERLVGSVKTCLKRTLGRKIPTHEEFFTLITQVEGIVNSRPLTKLEDLEKVLTPAMFLVGERKLGTPNPEVDLEDPNFTPKWDSADAQLGLWKRREKALDQFWDLWSTAYLNILEEKSGNRSHRRPRVVAKTRPWLRELVIIHEIGLPRASWKMGIIIDIHKNKSGEEKSATIRLPSGREITRPLNLIHPLEIPEKQPEDASEEETSGFSNNTEQQGADDEEQKGEESGGLSSKKENSNSTRPSREAAKKFRQRMKHWIEEDAFPCVWARSVAELVQRDLPRRITAAVCHSAMGRDDKRLL